MGKSKAVARESFSSVQAHNNAIQNRAPEKDIQPAFTKELWSLQECFWRKAAPEGELHPVMTTSNIVTFMNTAEDHKGEIQRIERRGRTLPSNVKS